MSQSIEVNRRSFLKGAVSAGASLGLAGSLAAKGSAQRVLGANDRINVGVVGVGGRGTYVAKKFAEIGKADNSCQIVAVCDVYQKRVTENKQFHNCDGYLDYREVINRPDIDAVIVATPDHWHAKVALEAMDEGQGRLLRKADGPHHRGSALAGRHGQREQARPAGRFADHFGAAVVEGQEGDRRRQASAT